MDFLKYNQAIDFNVPLCKYVFFWNFCSLFNIHALYHWTVTYKFSLIYCGNVIQERNRKEAQKLSLSKKQTKKQTNNQTHIF